MGEGMAAVNDASLLHLVSYQEEPEEESDMTVLSSERIIGK